MASRPISRTIFRHPLRIPIRAPRPYRYPPLLFRPPPQPSRSHHFHPLLSHQYSTQSPPEPKPYTFSTLQPLTLSPSPSRLIIDVREPSELASTGRIPGAKSMPITSNPEAVFLPADEFEEKFGFEKPGSGSQGEVEGQQQQGSNEEKDQRATEVIFYCKAGVRSRAAARMAGMEGGWEGVEVGDLRGGWLKWEENGGKVER